MGLARIAAAVALASTGLAAGCGGHGGSTATGAQVDTTGTPLWSVRFVDADAPGLSVHAAEVDDAGDVFVLAHDDRDESLVYEFGPSGGLAARVLVRRGAGLFEGHVRVNDTGIVVSGTQSGSDGPTLVVDRFDARREHVFSYSLAGATDGGIDLCDDGDAIIAAAGAPDGSLVDLDASGVVRWTATLARMRPSKVRCLGDATIRVAGVAGGTAVVARFESDGTEAWQWTGSDSVSGTVAFDVDTAGGTAVGATAGGQQAVYSLDGQGSLRWSWLSGGTADAFGGIAASDVVAVTGARGGDSLTSTLGSGSSIWTRDDAAQTSGAGVALDDLDDVFVCAGAGSSLAAVLYGPDGSTWWAYLGPGQAALRADVTGGIARCIGQAGDAIGIVAFEVR